MYNKVEQIREQLQILCVAIKDQKRILDKLPKTTPEDKLRIKISEYDYSVSELQKACNVSNIGALLDELTRLRITMTSAEKREAALLQRITGEERLREKICDELRLAKEDIKWLKDDLAEAECK